MVLTIKLRTNLKRRKEEDQEETEEEDQEEAENEETENETSDSSTPKAKARRKTSSEYSRARRERLKKNPEAWERIKEEERERHRQRRARRSEEKRMRDRETSRLRQQRFVRKMKENNREVPKRKEKVLTRREKEKRKEYNRIKKQESRARMSSQQKRRQREKNAGRKREVRTAKKKARNPKVDPQRTPACNTTHQGFKSSTAKRMAMSRLWSRMPRDPEKFGELVEEFIRGRRVTPRKRQVLERKCLLPPKHSSKKSLKFQELMSNEVRKSINQLKEKKDKSSRRDRRLLVSAHLISKRYRMKTLLSRQLDVRPSYLTSISKFVDGDDHQKTRRSDATPLEVIENIQSFYKSPRLSRELPYMKALKKQEPRRIMEVSLARAYEMWKEEHGVAQVSFSLFQKLRPGNVLLQRRNKLNQCLCEYCTDISLKLEALNRAATAFEMPEVRIKDSHELLNLTMCPKVQEDRFHELACVDRECENCGVSLLKHKLTKLMDDHGDTPIHWLKWKDTKFEHNGKTKSKKVLTTQRMTVTDLIEELLAETEKFAKHLFNAHWQHSMFSTICSNLPQDWIVLVLDFAENYACLSQNEIQSAHWATEQVTVHPVVAYYNCTECPPTESHVVQEALVFISNDLVHDHHAVHNFEATALQYLQETRSVPFVHALEFTDGCSAQYKSRGPFADISYARSDFGVEFERSYFGSRHGKGPSDGVSGVVKSGVRRAVVSQRVVVNNAEEMFSFCKENLTLENCKKQWRTFFFVEKNDIRRDRPDRDVCRPVKGTRSFHSVKSVKPGVMESRLLSCFCERCLVNDPETCLNAKHVTPWKEEHLKMKLTPQDQQTEATEVTVQEESCHFEELTADDVPTFFQSIDVHLDGDVNESNTHVEADGTAGLSAVDLSAEVLDTCLSMNQLIDSVLSEASDGVEGNGHGPNQEQTDVNNNGPSTEEKEDDMQVGDYVAVIFDDKWYPGEVTEMKGSNINVNFMESKGDNKFVWPSKMENISMGKHGIFSKLSSPPAPVSSRYLGFEPHLYKTITERVTAYLSDNG